MSLIQTPGGACAPAGFLAAGVPAGIKTTGDPDLALLLSEKPAQAAGVFTKNTAAAAPVLVSKERIRKGLARGVVVNSGCANACTGEQGAQDAVEMAALAAALAGADPAQMLVCSTGLIGSHLPMERVREGIKAAFEALGRDDAAAARAIMTTDTKPKTIAFRHTAGWSVGGIAKGAGMIAPNMATMLAFITADAGVRPGELQAALSGAVQETFNAISVDGDTSTNDTVLAFANGASGREAPFEDLREGIEVVCRRLARMMVEDGEGTTKVVAVKVSGAADPHEARLAARAVAESTLVKTAVYGEDANWGRVVAALGNSGAQFELARLSVSMAGVRLYENGRSAAPEAVSRARAAMSVDEIELSCDLGAGKASAQMLSTDLSPDYVKLNAAYES